MAKFPEIDSPCPLKKSRSVHYANENFCNHCQRQVHNLNAMSETKRKAFLESCNESICVSYAVKKPKQTKTIWALSIAASVSTMPTITHAASDPVNQMVDEIVVIGGIKDPKQAKWQNFNEVEEELPELPIIVEKQEKPI